MRRVLVVEDDELFRRSVERALRERFAVEAVDSVEAAKGLLEEERPDLILLDMMLPEVGGMELLRYLQERMVPVPVVVMTAVEQVSTAVEVMKSGAIDYLIKPLTAGELELAVDRALEDAELRSEVEQRRRLQLETNQRFRLLGTSSEMARVRQGIATAGASDATVLIVGETGTGKELVARGLHAASPRAAGAFVAVNCGAVPKDLFEAEFFGYKKGAFTGAESAGVGKFRLAHRGTLLLDEVGELPIEAQVKLLRVLEEQEFYPVGSTEMITVDTRVVASTHRDLEAMVAEGRFREDLFFRLNVYRIEIPPLRERQGDIPELAAAFLAQFNEKFEKRFRRLSSAAEDLLRGQTWPGNVRELRNVLERAVLAHNGSVLSSDQIDLLQRRTAATARAREASRGFGLPPEGVSLEEVERTLIGQALEQAKGNKSQAARLLGLTPATLYYRLRKHGMEDA